MVVYKRIAALEVTAIVDRQLEAGMTDPAVVFLKNLVQSLHTQEEERRRSGAGESSAPRRDTPTEPPPEPHADDFDPATLKASVHCCICCFHWINRRRDLPVTVLPMQSLLYFLLGIDSVESKKCDKRVLNPRQVMIRLSRYE